MKKHSKEQPTGKAPPPAHFEFLHAAATRVCLAGTFNDWRPEVTPMVPIGEGCWMKDLTLPRGVYEYRIIADGEWMLDPLAAETVPNPFGGLNSVVRVP